MGATIHNVLALAAAGRRWFARPPEGYEAPPVGAVSDVGAYANLLMNCGDSGPLSRVITRLTDEELAVRLTYIHTIQTWLKQNGPTFFPEQDILEACEHTDVLSSVQGSDIKTVYPVGYISLPKNRGFHSTAQNDDIRHIWFKILEPNEPLSAVIGSSTHDKLFAPGRRLFMQAYWSKSTDIHSFSLPLDEPDMSLEDALDKSSKQLTHGFNTSRNNFLDEVAIDAKKLGKWMGSLVANLMLIMQSYPKYLDKLPTEKSQRQGFKNASPPLSIRIRRSTPRPVRQTVQGNERGPVCSTGRTLGNHWRRGHWRRQPHGDQYELENPEVQVIVLADGRHAHMKWIIPIYIGLESSETGNQKLV